MPTKRRPEGGVSDTPNSEESKEISQEMIRCLTGDTLHYYAKHYSEGIEGETVFMRHKGLAHLTTNTSDGEPKVRIGRSLYVLDRDQIIFISDKLQQLLNIPDGNLIHKPATTEELAQMETPENPFYSKEERVPVSLKLESGRREEDMYKDVTETGVHVRVDIETVDSEILEKAPDTVRSAGNNN